MSWLPLLLPKGFYLAPNTLHFIQHVTFMPIRIPVLCDIVNHPNKYEVCLIQHLLPRLGCCLRSFAPYSIRPANVWCILTFAAYLRRLAGAAVRGTTVCLDPFKNTGIFTTTRDYNSVTKAGFCVHRICVHRIFHARFAPLRMLLACCHRSSCPAILRLSTEIPC